MIDWLAWLGWGLLKILGFTLTYLLAFALVFGFFAFVFFCLCVISNLFVKEVNDPELGKMKVGFGDCDGQIVLEGKRRIHFTLPSDKKQANAKAKAMLLSARDEWPMLKANLLEHFAREVVDEGVPPDLIKRAKWVEKLARERDYENLQRYTRLSRIEVEHSEKNGPLQLRISTLHRWDPEHDRVLILDENLAVKFYALGCQC